MSDPNELMRAFNYMKLFTQDQLIITMRPELRDGVLEAIQIFEQEILKLKSERAELEEKLGLRRLSISREESSKDTPETQTTESREPDVNKSNELPGRPELSRPSGPIDIGRPYPVYMICFACNKRVLTTTTEKSTGGCCLSCLTERPPVTVLHTCPLCHTFLGLYYDRQEDESIIA